jgi:CRISPR/Cas system CSM-associated protein Csm3 (group 7 of RAMP superfamily)
MNSKLLVTCISMMLCALNSNAIAQSEKIISMNNGYNGKSIEVTYTNKDKEYKVDGINRSIVQMDIIGAPRKIEYFFNNAYKTKEGKIRMSNLINNNNSYATSVYFTETYSKNSGYDQAIIYNNYEGKNGKEYYMNHKLVKSDLNH